MRPASHLDLNVLLRSEETGGHVSVTEIVMPPRSPGPPLHTHSFDEAFYVLEGELTFQIADAVMTKTPGEISFAPRDVAHALANLSDTPARYALVCTPAGFERHWARVAAEAAGAEPPQWALQPIPEVAVVGPRSPSSRSVAPVPEVARLAGRGAPPDIDRASDNGFARGRRHMVRLVGLANLSALLRTSRGRAGHKRGCIQVTDPGFRHITGACAV